MSKFFINRPIVAIVIAIFTVIVGAVAVLADHKSLPQDQDFFTQEYPYEGIEEQAKWQSK